MGVCVIKPKEVIQGDGGKKISKRAMGFREIFLRDVQGEAKIETRETQLAKATLKGVEAEQVEQSQMSSPLSPVLPLAGC